MEHGDELQVSSKPWDNISNLCMLSRLVAIGAIDC
jgi:hypothetical protein